jgi:methionine synthase I (cobalamin-dependent)/5,10-methylenetetrahydrofolate reductase
MLADGGMGTEIYARGTGANICYDLVNLEDPELIGAIHRDYLHAGAELIETNSFGANRIKLELYQAEGQIREINRAAGRIARQARDAVGSLAFIAGSMGPLGKPLGPRGDISEKTARSAFQEQAGALIEGGVDVLILETFADLNELCLALQALQEMTDLPIIAQATFDEDGRTPRGQTAVKVASALMDLGADVIGVNCSVGPQIVLDIACQMVSVGATYVSAMPNAGMPARSGGRLMYFSTPGYFGEMVPGMLSAGIRILGGCCGTKPAHIATMRSAMDAVLETGDESRAAQPCYLVQVEEPERGERPAPTGFAQKLDEGRFVVSVELSPPKGLEVASFVDRARALADSGVVDVVNITDSPMARVRMAALPACAVLQLQTGVETVLHFTTRDRNFMGLQADLLGAHAAGVRNILALTGDPPSLGDYAHATGVFDVDSIGLVQLIKEMKGGHDLQGKDMGYPAGFCVGVALDPTTPELEREAQRLREKIDAGAEFVMTQPLFDLPVWERFMEVYGEPIPIPVLLGILPLLSDRHASFLHNEVPGITLTDEVLERMRAAGSNGRHEGTVLAQEMLLEAKEKFAGAYIMPSYNRHEIALDVLDVL